MFYLSPNNSLRYPAAYKGLTLLLALWLCAGMLVYLPDNGGSGLALPFNILCWIVMATSVVWLTVTLPSNLLRICWRKSGLWLLPCGAFFWSLPLLWSPTPALMRFSLAHVIALWGFLGLLWLFLRVPFSERRLQCWLRIIGYAALLQAIWGFLQVVNLSPASELAASRPTGIFQQANVLASFSATGLACLLSERVMIKSPPRLLDWLTVTALFFLSFMLVLCQSRAGWLGGIFSTLIICTASIRQRQRFTLLLRQIMPLLIGVAFAIAWQRGLIDAGLQALIPGFTGLHLADWFIEIDKAGSTHERLYILHTTWGLIKSHPFTGVGYGGFESAFANETLATHGVFNEATLIHPHNELLYAWAEGGIIAILGLLLMISGVLYTLWKRGNRFWPAVALLLPIAIHMNLEYPLYQSVPHGMVLIMLLSLVLRPSETENMSHTNSKFIATLTRGCLLFFALVVVALMLCALQTQQTLIQFERQNLYPFALQETSSDSPFWFPASQANRIDYDKHVALLIRYNLTHEEYLLVQFEQWAQGYLKQHNDPNIMQSRILIAKHSAPAQVSGLCQYAHELWPNDLRFGISTCP